MVLELRKSGISVVGDVPWATHFCHFYETKQDLLDTLVPYFKAGLESKEFCLWVVSNPELVTVEEAKAALAQAVPDLDRHLSEKNIEILSGHDWYFENDALNLERVRSAWDAKLKQALARGYAGLRASADTFWLAEKDLEDFCHYEKQVDDWVTDQRMTVLCTYPLAKSGAAEIFGVLQAHQFATAIRRGEWQVIQTPELIQAQSEIRRLNQALQQIPNRKSERPAILRYGMAVLSVAAALIIAQFLEIYLVPAPGMLLLCALMFSAWYGGLKPSLLAMALSLLAFKYYFVTPIHSLTVEARELPRLLIFSLLSAFVVALSAAQRNRAESLRRARDVLAGTVQEQNRTNQELRTKSAERKQAEERLHAKEQEFRAIVENAPDQIIRYDREFRRTYVNPAVARTYGVPAEALIGKPIGSVIQDAGLDVKEDELAQLRQRIATVFDTGNSYDFEMPWLMPNGRKLYSVRLFPELDLNGSVIHVLGIARDITARKRAEEALDERLRFETLVTELSASFANLSPNEVDREIDNWLQALVEFLGVDRASFFQFQEDWTTLYRSHSYTAPGIEPLPAPPIGMKDQFPWITDQLRKGVTVKWSRIPDDLPEEAVKEKEYAARLGAKSGLNIPVRMAGSVICAITFTSVVTYRDWPDALVARLRLVGEIFAGAVERKRAEAALRKSEEQFRQLSEAAFEAIILHDQGTILEVNQSFCRMYGYERAEVIGKSVLDLALPEFREPLRQRVRSGDTDSYEGPALRKDGTTFRAELAGKPIHYQGRTVRVAAIRDITEQKRNERRQAAQYGVTRVLAESATLAEATPQLLRVICESLRWKMGEFWRVCDSTNLLRCVETWHVPGLDATAFIEASRQTELAPGVGLPGRVWQSGQPAWIPDVMTDPRFARAAIAAKVGLRGAVAFPILLGNHTLGLMLFFSRRAPEVDEDLLKMMSAIGSQIGQFTERKRAEEALKKSEQDFRNLFEQAHDAIIVFNPEHEIVLDVNERACELYGFTRSEFIGMSLEAISKDVVRGKNEIGKTQERGVFLNFETVQYRKDGTEMFLEINASTILYQGQLVILSINRDVTERKRADEKLQNSERYFRSLIENASDLITISDGNGIIRYESPSLERMLGYRPEERMGKSVLDLLHPDDLQFAKRHFAKGIQNPGIVQIMECRFQHKDGSWHLVETTGINLLDDPVVAGIVVNSRDITERKLAEEALRQAEQKYRRIFENASEGIFQSTPDGRFIAANPALARMHGFASPEELIHSHPDISQQVYVDPTRREEFKRQLEEQGAVRGFEYQVFRKDGSNIWFSVNARAVRDEQGAIQYYEGTAQDITDRKRAEEALRESEERYRELFENAKDATYVHDLGGKYTSVNRAAEKLMGYARAEILGKELIHFFPPEQIEHIRECSLKLADEGETAYESELITKEGRRVAVQVESHLIFENGVPVGVQGTARDITERKAAEEKLTANSAQLRALSARLQSAREEEGTRIAREIHDELGSVLTSLKWDLEGSDKILAGPLEPSQAAALREKLQALMKLTDVAISSIRRIASELRPSVLDDLGLAAAIEWQAQQFQARTGIVCVCDCSPKTLDLSEEQSTALFRILQEALTNVLRHAQATRVDIKLSIENGYFVLSVSDNGRGITESAEAEQQSLGILGMRERAHLIGGEIDITGIEGQGTVVVVRVPISGHDRVLKMTS